MYRSADDLGRPSERVSSGFSPAAGGSASGSSAGPGARLAPAPVPRTSCRSIWEDCKPNVLSLGQKTSTFGAIEPLIEAILAALIESTRPLIGAAGGRGSPAPSTSPGRRTGAAGFRFAASSPAARRSSPGLLRGCPRRSGRRARAAPRAGPATPNAHETDKPHDEPAAGKKTKCAAHPHYLGNASGSPPSTGSVAPVVGVKSLAKNTTALPTCSAVMLARSRFRCL